MPEPTLRTSGRPVSLPPEVERVTLEGLVVRAGERTLVHHGDLSLSAGEIVGLVGPSGAGKTLLVRALLGLVPFDPGVVAGVLRVEGGPIPISPYDGAPRGSRALDRAFAPLRGPVFGWLPQDARAALDPVQTVREQLEATARLAQHPPGTAAHWLAKAGFAAPESVLDRYPHTLSGGMAQRVGIAQVLARGSRFLLADEPTTGLDPTVSVTVLRELRALADAGRGVLLVTHDLTLLDGIADAVVIVDGGRTVERTSARALLDGTARSEAARRLAKATLAVEAR